MRKSSVVSLVAASVVLVATSARAQDPKPPAAPAAPAPAKPPAAKPPDPAKPVEPADPAKPVDPAAKPTDPAKPADPAKPPADPAAPDEVEEQPGEPGEEPGSEVEGPDAPRTTAPGASPLQPLQNWPQPGADAAALRKQGDPGGARAAPPAKDEIFAEDWWSHARPILELHGYFRVRAELFHNFSLGRTDPPGQALWPMPADNRYNIGETGLVRGPALCTPDESGVGSNDDATNAEFPCKNKTQAGANLRFRVAPELHVSDNLRVMSQIDILDNLVLGSTPEGYANQPSSTGYDVSRRSGYTALGLRDESQVPPSSGINSFKDSIRVKRAWAEYATPVGELRFGRMPHHWGLGMLHNSGDGYDDDYQSTIDRIQFTSGFKALDLYISGSWDFPNEGQTSESLALPQGQPYDVSQLDDVNQWSLGVFRRKDPALTEQALGRGDVVLNGGAYVLYRKQLLASDFNGSCNDPPDGGASLGCPIDNLREEVGVEEVGFIRRDANVWIPDLWLQLLYKGFRFELEAATIQGSLHDLAVAGDYINDSPTGDNGWRIAEWGVATEIEQKLVEDKLRLQFNFGWASGDPDVDGTGLGTDNAAGGLSPGLAGLQPQLGDRTFSTFRFNPSYRVDMILNRNILSRVQGVYYFRPGVEYDFVRHPNGQRLGGSFAGIWTRASEFVQAPGHDRDLGIELNASLYFQSKDGALNDKPGTMGGFFTMLQYGVLFPMGGLGYQDTDPNSTNTTAAQGLRWYLGVMY